MKKVWKDWTGNLETETEDDPDKQGYVRKVEDRVDRSTWFHMTAQLVRELQELQLCKEWRRIFFPIR